MEKSFQEIENIIDRWVPQMLNRKIPRYKYIYHCLCVFSDMMINQKVLFSSAESLETQVLFALNYNIHLAYRYLLEDKEFDYGFDCYLYQYTTVMMWNSVQYAKLCDIFPRLYSERAFLQQSGKYISFEYKAIPREKNRLVEYNLLRRPLSYLLQYACGMTTKIEETKRQVLLLDFYKHYWGENLWKNDYEPYTAMEGSGIRDFFLMAALKRFMMMYDNDFRIPPFDLCKTLICFSKEGVKQIRDIIPTKNEEYYQAAFEDCVYKPLGKGDFPKANIADAPIIRTNNGCSFTNPLVILFNNSLDTQFLNYLRRHDNTRFLNIKDKIKERCIPQVQSLLNRKIKGIKDIVNFEVKIPGKGNHKRELDYLVVDTDCVGLYIEFKHFYIPESAGEVKVLDAEFNKAMKKMPDQLLAIQESWNTLSQKDKLPSSIKELNGIIVSYMFTGWDVPFNDQYPLINMSILSNAIEHSDSLHSIYKYCCNVEKVYKNVPTVTKYDKYDYANHEFEVKYIALNPEFEKKFNEILQKQVYRKLTDSNVLHYVPYMNIDFNEILKVQGHMD